MPRLTPVHYKALIKVFRQVGFSIDRQTSSHILMTKKNIPRPLVIPAYDEVEVSIIRGLLRSAGMSRSEYFRLLH
ncbi:MAG: type II toxin-antitoxin system HicA family toxin [Acidobacteriota bacterium]|nr:type II toxin-antitoxin system HicA family toxin [Acidobacteriota bacterium]